jgi:hypothetical protein
MKNLFISWFEQTLLPREALGTDVLILDGHSSHCSAPELLQFAKGNDIVILGLTSHSTQRCSPLYRGSFCTSRTSLKEDANHRFNSHQNRKVKGMQLGILIGGVWSGTASVTNAVPVLLKPQEYPCYIEIQSQDTSLFKNKCLSSLN